MFICFILIIAAMPIWAAQPKQPPVRRPMPISDKIAPFPPNAAAPTPAPLATGGAAQPASALNPAPSSAKQPQAKRTLDNGEPLIFTYNLTKAQKAGVKLPVQLPQMKDGKGRIADPTSAKYKTFNAANDVAQDVRLLYTGQMTLAQAQTKYTGANFNNLIQVYQQRYTRYAVNPALGANKEPQPYHVNPTNNTKIWGMANLNTDPFIKKS